MDALQNMPRYPAYKASGVEWLGEIPEGWEIKKLKFSCKINSESLPDTTPAKTLIEYVDIGSISFEKGIEGTESFFFGDAPSRARRIASAGDTVVSTVRTYLKAISFVDEKASKYIYSTGFAVLSPSVMLASKYLSNFIKSSSFTNQVDGVAKGMNYPAVNSSELSNLYVVAPSILEQQAIAKFLDEKTGQIDEAIAIKAQQIELLKERKQIIIQNAVTRGLNHEAPLRDSGIDWIGEIPEHWEVYANRTIFSERIEPGRDGLPLLSVSIHSGVSSEEISDEENIRGRVKIADKSKYNAVEPNDIVFNMMRAWQGAIGAVKVHGMVSPAYIIAKPKVKFVSKFFEYQYRAPEFIQQMDRYSKGITDFRKRLYWDGFKQLPTICPPYDEQMEIVEHIGKQDAKIDSAIVLQQQQIDRLKEYKTTLINSAVTGKVRVPLAGERQK